jgi:hypothetical protein
VLYFSLFLKINLSAAADKNSRAFPPGNLIIQLEQLKDMLADEVALFGLNPA